MVAWKKFVSFIPTKILIGILKFAVALAIALVIIFAALVCFLYFSSLVYVQTPLLTGTVVIALSAGLVAGLTIIFLKMGWQFITEQAVDIFVHRKIPSKEKDLLRKWLTKIWEWFKFVCSLSRQDKVPYILSVLRLVGGVFAFLVTILLLFAIAAKALIETTLEQIMR